MTPIQERLCVCVWGGETSTQRFLSFRVCVGFFTDVPFTLLLVLFVYVTIILSGILDL